MMLRNLMRLRSLPTMARVVRVGGKAKPKATAKAQRSRPAAKEVAADMRQRQELARKGRQAALVSVKVSTVAQARAVSHVARQVKAKAGTAKPLTGG